MDCWGGRANDFGTARSNACNALRLAFPHLPVLSPALCDFFFQGEVKVCVLGFHGMEN